MNITLVADKDYTHCTIIGVPPANPLVLDVGCGDTPTGDVNCDLYQNVRPEEYGIWAPNKTMRPKTIPNFVQCSAEALPFKDNAFGAVHANQVLEHVPNWIQALREFLRVSSCYIVWTVPAKEEDWFPTKHLHFFHPRTITNTIHFLQFSGEFQIFHEMGEYKILMEKSVDV